MEILKEFIGLSLDLMDRHGLCVGKIYPTAVTENLTVIAIFTSGEYFELYRPFFLEHEQLVLNQLFTHADRLEKVISEFDFRVKNSQSELLAITDVQLMNAVDISFKIVFSDNLAQ
jgi:hypothetical protein